ncbi:PIN domain nuclease [Methanosarcinales archaeon]|nr:MAG: PIN domain nuclease [Methanosarcinales archaeon]
MKEKCLIDTSILLKVILEGEIDVLGKLSEYSLHISFNVLEETSFKIIISSVLETLNLERCNFYKIKKEFEKGRGKELVVKRLHLLNVIKDKLIVLELNEAIFGASKEIIKRYCLLPNDAIIAATCKSHGIKKIASFDSDFKRVDFLEILPQ